MTSTKKITYKQIKASQTKIDAILHLVKIKGKVSTLTLSADIRTKVPQARTILALAPNLYLSVSKEEITRAQGDKRNCFYFHSQGKVVLTLSVCHSATKIIGFSTDRLFMFQEPRGKRNRSHQTSYAPLIFCCK